MRNRPLPLLLALMIFISEWVQASANDNVLKHIDWLRCATMTAMLQTVCREQEEAGWECIGQSLAILDGYFDDMGLSHISARSTLSAPII